MSGITGNSFVNRAIDVTLTIGQGTFGQTGFNTVKLSGLRVEVSIVKGGMPTMDTADIRIYGVQPSVMNQLSTWGVPFPMLRLNNTVTLAAGDGVTMPPIFNGHVLRGWQDFDNIPETCLHILSQGGVAAAIVPVPPISFPGGADVATIMSGLATTMGLAFENNGVQVQLSNPYFAGTALQQAQKCAQAAHIQMLIDSSTVPNTLVIVPWTGTRGGAIPIISAATGMIGYPRYFDYGVSFRCLFNPNLKMLGKIKLETSIGNTTPATAQAPAQTGLPSGIWYVSKLAYDLASQVPDGPWFCDASGAFTAVATG